MSDEKGNGADTAKSRLHITVTPIVSHNGARWLELDGLDYQTGGDSCLLRPSRSAGSGRRNLPTVRCKQKRRCNPSSRFAYRHHIEALRDMHVLREVNCESGRIGKLSCMSPKRAYGDTEETRRRVGKRGRLATLHTGVRPTKKKGIPHTAAKEGASTVEAAVNETFVTLLVNLLVMEMEKLKGVQNG